MWNFSWKETEAIDNPESIAELLVWTLYFYYP